MSETVRSIGEWSDATFGPGTVKARSLRLMQEVIELCYTAGASTLEIDATIIRTFHDVRRKGGAVARPEKVREEAADCGIVLDTIIWTKLREEMVPPEDVDREAADDKANKMGVNRGREWNLTGDGCGQHA